MAKNKAAGIIDKIAQAINPSSSDTSAEGAQKTEKSQLETPAAQVDDATAQGSTSRQRGPVEEVIAKRVKQLSKKIQRFQGYANLPEKSLNADQRAAVASLPVLTAQSRELEDLIKPGGAVEVVELNEAAKLRSAKEEAERLAKGDVDAQISSNIETISTKISLFLRLHALLLPARPADHTNLTFSPLDLPSQLQDEVQATDVLRVGRMYDELLSGGEAGRGIVQGLSAGPSGEDEENDHIHHLLTLLSLPAQEGSIPATRPDTPSGDAAGVANGDAAQQEQITTAPASEHGASHDVEEPSEVIQPASRAEGVAAAAPGFNFLQADELHAPASQQAEQQEQEQERKEGLEEYEVVPALEAHQTAEYDPASTSAQAPDLSSAAEPSSTTTPIPKSTPGLLVDDSAPVNWADDEDEPISLAPTPAPAPSTNAGSAPVQPVTSDAVPTLAAPVGETSGSASSAPANAPTGPRRGPGGGGRGRGRANGSGNVSGSGGRRTPQQQAQGQGQGKAQQSPQPVPGKPGVYVDADGFETRVRTGRNVQGSQGQQGRQGQGQGQAQGGRGGPGAGRGRGRGGPPRGDTRTPPAGNGSQQGGQGQTGARPPRHQGQGRQGSARGPQALAAAVAQ